jgi:hypothetical protein
MAELNGKNDDQKSRELRTVGAEQVAEYLRCDPQRLVTALRRLMKTPSSIYFGAGEAVQITPAAILHRPPESEAQLIGELTLMKPQAAKWLN